jgi:hypothetical protein
VDIVGRFAVQFGEDVLAGQFGVVVLAGVLLDVGHQVAFAVGGDDDADVAAADEGLSASGPAGPAESAIGVRTPTPLSASWLPSRLVTETRRRARETGRCGHRLFTANDRESTGIARFSPELRTANSVVPQRETSTHWNRPDLQLGSQSVRS